MVQNTMLAGSDKWYEKSLLGNYRISNTRLCFGYWNDNYFGQGLVDKLLPGNNISGQDDFLTANLWSGFQCKLNKKNIFTDVYLNIFTNKNENFRADYLTGIVSTDFKSRSFYLKTGLGIAGRGNFGGYYIQNAYHLFTGINEVELPYPENSLGGVLIRAEIEYSIPGLKEFDVNSYFIGSYCSDGIPSHMETGIKSDNIFSNDKHDNQYNIDFYLGYAQFYTSDEWTQGVFKEGWTWGILVSRSLFKNLNLALFTTRGQYCIKNEPQFGIIISLSWRGNPPGLGRVRFP